ncbi:RluA family pseudouridine synthase [Rhizosaccharibacter radicis]|uniref:RNA pseudouridine synthase n=1 Tax=Rhizosaccharibacter radicis TaxID=2782605 RepID=A0ABT1VSN7_9PROT|nr:RNA pseudouridine synthase [Acetobacteraceae bacterium KSS12]
MLPPILFRDERFVVLNKPAGLPVHAGPRGGISVEDAFPQLSRRRDGPWLAHRLDTDTAGCLLVALRRAALHEAQRCFAEGRAGKRYWAVSRGGPDGDAGEIDRPLSKRSDRAGWRMVVDPAGQAARTRWQVLGRSGGLCWLELTLLTGRTHQARVHLSAMGWPILGDPVYGPPPDGGDRLHLLARALSLPLQPPVDAVAPPPPHMLEALAACGHA